MSEAFTKPATDLKAQIGKYKSRGLIIEDEDLVEDRLRYIGYYRLSAYALPFQANDGDKPFKSGVKFSDILQIYEFDRKLRLLVMDALERIEVAIRATTVNTTCVYFGNPHWFMEKTHFREGGKSRFNFDKFIRTIEDSIKVKQAKDGLRAPQGSHHEVFIDHYYRRYGKPDLPPFWMVAETLPLGSISRIFAALMDADVKKNIASVFDVHENLLEGWLEALTYLRNLCAHHCRLWNRVFSIMPKVPNRMRSDLAEIGTDISSRRFFVFAIILYDLLSRIDHRTQWNKRLICLLDENPFVQVQAMGFPDKWHTSGQFGVK